MNLQEAIEILKRFNKWRRGAVIEMEHPKELGIAIDIILEYFEKQKDESNKQKHGSKRLDDR